MTSSPDLDDAFPPDDKVPAAPVAGDRANAGMAALLGHGLQGSAGSSNAGSWEPPDPETLKALLPRYDIETLIGRGGMGAVYKGSQAKLGRHVAIKLLPAELAEDESFVARFEREARTLAGLDHPGILHVHDFGQTSAGHLYFVMEHVDGTDLHRLIHGPGVDPAQALSIIGQVCDALEFAHANGVVHRDIKPANILVTPAGRVKLADFGLARPMQSDGSGPLTLTRMVMGTPDYMAPEQKRGEGDHRVDLYALGVMLYEMLCGRTPQGAWQPPSQQVPVDARLDRIVIKAMQEEPARRYQQASEVKTDIEAIRGSHPSQAPTKVLPRGGSRKIPAVLAAVIFGSLSAFGVWWSMRKAPAPAVAKPVPQTAAAPAAPRPLLDDVIAPWKELPEWKAFPNGDRVTRSPDGKIALDFSGLPIRDLSPLARLTSLPITSLNLELAPVSDLTPLSGLPIEELHLRFMQVRDLTPLRGMPLRLLNVQDNPITTLDGLQGAPLEHLVVAGCPLTSLEALRGGKTLAHLNLRHARNIRDLTPLAGLPLKHLDLNSTAVVSLAGLQDCPLETLDADYMNHLQDLSALRGSPVALVNLWHTPGIRNYSPLRDCPGLRTLRLMGYPASAEVLRSQEFDTVNDLPPAGYWALWDEARKMDGTMTKLRADLAAAGAGPLQFGEHAVSLHSPGRLTVALAGAKLRSLDVLRGYPVAQLELAGADYISDLEPLRGMALERLFLSSGGPVTDIRPLADCPTLEMIELSSGVTDVEPLRKLPNLMFLSYRWDGALHRPEQTAAEFWKEHDAKKPGR